MSRRHRTFRRLFRLRRWGPPVDDGVDWEIDHHLQERVDQLMESGMPRRAAEREARRLFGDAAALKRELRRLDRSTARRRTVAVWLETVAQDLYHTLRGIRRNRGLAAALVLTLGLGIGATVAVFSVVDALLLRPLPYSDPHELVDVLSKRPDQEVGTRYLPWEVVREWRDIDSAFTGMMPHARQTVLFTGGSEPENIIAHHVDPSFEEVLGVPPIIGRGLRIEDANPGAEPVALLSYGFWRTAFGGSDSVVGRTIRLDDTIHTVIGVMPAGFKFPTYATTECWLPLRDDTSVRGNHVELVARVQGGDLAAATARANVTAQALFQGRRGLDSASVALRLMNDWRGGNSELHRAVWLVFGGVGLILLVALINASNLLLVRGAVRTREIAVRAAIGASRGRLMRQLMTETLVLALLGGGIAWVVSLAVLQGVQDLLPDTLIFRLPHAIAVEHRALTVAFGLATAGGILAGLLAALGSTGAVRATPSGALSTYAVRTPARSRLRRGLAIGEVALSVILLVGAGLLLNSFIRLTAVDIGIDTENLALLQVPLSSQALPDSSQRAAFLPQLEERVRTMPGVVSATATGSLPANSFFFGTQLQAEGSPPAGGDPQMLPSASVSPAFFEVMGARLLAGRPFFAWERSSDVAIVDEHLARHLWPNEQAVGKRFRIRSEDPWHTVVGVVADIQLDRRDDAWGDFEILFPFDATTARGYVTLAFRSATNPTRLFAAVRAAVHELAPNQPINEIVLAKDAYGEAIEIPRFLAALVSGLAAFALALAGIGLFAVLAHEVAQRRRELGIRMAMGARAGQVQLMVLREGLVLALIGGGIGVAVALAFSRFIRSMLFELEPTDPATLTAAVATMFVAAVAAGYVPARRATRVDPVETLRDA